MADRVKAARAAGKSSGLAGAARYLQGGPLGIVIACLLLVEGIAGIVAAAVPLSESNKQILVFFCVLFPVFVIAFFFYVWLRHPLLMYAPGSFKDEKAFFEFLARRGVPQVPAAPSPWNDPRLHEGELLLGGAVTLTGIMELFHSLQDIKSWQYLVVDIKAGRRWLISRLFVFTFLLQRLHGLRSVVFVQSDGGLDRRLIGLAEPADVLAALALKYPWFKKALDDAWNKAGVPIYTDRLSLDQAREIMGDFVGALHRSDSPGENPEWSQLRDYAWEHSPWLDAEHVERDLRATFYDPQLSMVERSPDMSERVLLRSILKRHAPFVATVNSKREFLSLYDRQAFIDRFADQMPDAA